MTAILSQLCLVLSVMGYGHICCTRDHAHNTMKMSNRRHTAPQAGDNDAKII